MNKIGNIIFTYASPSISGLIIMLNSIAIYKMANPSSMIKASKNDQGNTNTTRQIVQSSSSKSEGTVNQKENLNKNKNTKEFKNDVNKRKRQSIPRTTPRISKNVLLLLNLAISDLIIGTDVILVKLLLFIYEQDKNRVIFYITAFFHSCLLQIPLSMSIANLLLLASLRLYAIRRPMKYRTVTKKFIIKICIFLWVSTSLFIVLKFIFPYRSWSPCLEQYYVIVIPYVFVAVIVFSVTFLLIFKSIRTRVGVGNSDRGNTKKSGDKTFKVGSYSVIAFAICWLPLALWSLVDQVADQDSPVGFLLTCLAFFNSVINPIFYFVVFRKYS